MAPHCPWRVYKGLRGPGEGQCCYNMAEVIEAVLGSNSDAENKTEIADVRKVPEIKERKTPCQSKDKEREKVRLPYSCTSSFSPSIPYPRPLSCPCLAQNPFLGCAHSFKVPLPNYFPLPSPKPMSFRAHFVFLPAAEDTCKS